MLLAKWSDKGAVENQQNVFLTVQVRQAKWVASEIRQAEIRCRLVERNARHDVILFNSFLKRLFQIEDKKNTSDTDVGLIQN